MIAEFVERYMTRQADLRAVWETKHPEDYGELVLEVVKILRDKSKLHSPDPDCIHTIDDGGYQGTLLYVIGESDYQPRHYWWVAIDYGSCSGCDTLQAIKPYSDTPPTKQQVDDYMTLSLHIVQRLKSMGELSMEEP